MYKKYPSVKTILDDMDSIDKVIKWAEANGLSDHPLVRKRLNQCTVITEIVNTITDPDVLTEWAIDNLLLQHEQVLNRLQVLLTCKTCSSQFDSSIKLRQHKHICQMQNKPSGSLTCAWCGLKSSSHVELTEHENFHASMDSFLTGEINTNCRKYKATTETSLDLRSHAAKQKRHESSMYEREKTEKNDDEPSNNSHEYVQYGKGLDNDLIPYTFQQTNQKTFAKNRATETTYRLKFRPGWKNHRMKNLIKEISEMFEDVIDRVKGNGGDLGRIIINHPEFHHALAIPLDKWSNIDAEKVMQRIEGYLNSDENLPIDDQMTVVVGNISVPKGSGKSTPITRLYGDNSSIALKRSLLRVENSEDHLCLPTSIGRTFVKLCPIVTLDEWRSISKEDPPSMNATMKVIKHRVMTGSYLRNIKTPSNNSYRKTMALTLCREAGVPTDRPLSLEDIKPFEDILVLSAKLCNKFCRVANEHGRKNIYLYLTQLDNGEEHFDGIGSISGFFDYGYFCETCLKPYKNKGKHSCQTTCDVCGSNECISGDDTMSCYFCHRDCRSKECYDRHFEKKDKRGRDIEKSMCDKMYQCKQCRKVLERSKRKPADHRCREWRCQNCFRYQLGQHLCYQRATSKSPRSVPRKFFFYDFETYQRDDIIQCQQGCTRCRTCTNCSQSTCGLYEHKVFYAVLQSTCENCGANDDEDEVTEESKCSTCGSRCEKCRIHKEKHVLLPCSDTCGYRQRIFRGTDAAIKFCSHIMTRHYKNTVLIAHNAKGFDNYPILNALIDHHGVKPDKILYNGSKIMYMHVAHGLDLTFIDSLNFMQMKLSKIPECFGLKELQKGYFPHLFSSPSVFDYKNGCWPTPWYYGTDSMSEKALETFMKWYETKKHERFDFQDELYKYATEDVRILRAGSMKFRRLMMQVTMRTNDKGEVLGRGTDPFDYVTIASVCQGIFRDLFLKETYTTTITERRNNVKTTCPSQYIDGKLHLRFAQGEEWIPIENIEDRYLVGNTQFQESDIALVPSEGYITDSFSKASIQWLEFLMYERRQKGRPLEIIHGLNGREHREGPYRLDGYHTDGSTTRTAFEFMGCVYHGCPECFPNDRTTVRHPVTKHSMSELYYATKKKENDLKMLGYRYVCIWEHEFRDQLKTNSEMREFVSTLDITDRLRPRSSFVGGRTNTIKLYHEVTEAGRP
ncbi:unnamed protein product [Mytilus coruscus]|uniref:DNA-directed DNA polymerase n=1 Tax=Mytilus coruscus TaxID=42192 RepID=A0A6J8AQZ6_MYTCO|nr:unnamed protein product [Mytilus coruscus]